MASLHKEVKQKKGRGVCLEIGNGVSETCQGLAHIQELFREDRYDRQLYGASVVDAYIDLAAMQRFVVRRLPHLIGVQRTRVLYMVLGLADRGRGLHG